MLRALADGIQVCVTVTLVDGLVLARSAFHHSMNYRSVVVFGTAYAVEVINYVVCLWVSATAVGANRPVNAGPKVAQAHRQFSQTAHRREAPPRRGRT